MKTPVGKSWNTDLKDLKWRYSYLVRVILLEASTFIKLSQYIFYLFGGIWRDTIQMENIGKLLMKLRPGKFCLPTV